MTRCMRRTRATGCGRLETFTRVITLEGDLTEDQRGRLLEIADKCPVHRTLERGSHVHTRLA
jgi:uncharacterized OsmC-like protein